MNIGKKISDELNNLKKIRALYTKFEILKHTHTYKKIYAKTSSQIYLSIINKYGFELGLDWWNEKYDSIEKKLRE